MKLERVLAECAVAIRQRHGYTTFVYRVNEGYRVCIAEDGLQPHFIETYSTLAQACSLFAESCSWQPYHPRAVHSAQTVPASRHVPYTREQVERFWLKVDRSGECWIWKGNLNTTSGFGVARTENGRMFAHRVAWELTHSVQLTAEEYILHLTVEQGCGNILCVRPDHLYLTRERRIAHSDRSMTVETLIELRTAS